MQQIQQQALRTFEQNLLFLEKNDEGLFSKIVALNSAIENEHYKERYALEHINGYFDVKELQSEHFLYGFDSNTHAELTAKSIDFSKTNNIFESFHNYKFDKKRLKELSELSIEDDPLVGAYELIELSQKVANKEKTTMKKIYKFIFLGSALALHIQAIAQTFKCFNYFIIEDNLELFRLSLFVTNYAQIAKDGAEITFSVFDEEQEFIFKTKQFISKSFIYNQQLKFFHMPTHSDVKLISIQNLLASQIHLLFDYSTLSHNMIRPLNHLKHSYKFLDISMPYIGSVFQEKPVLFLAAGPSLGKNIEWVKQNRDNFILVALSATLAKLEKEKIKPDIITHLDGFDVAMKHINGVKDFSFFDDSIVICSAFTQARFLKKFEKENIYLYEIVSSYKDGFGKITASNIGIVTLGLLLRFGVKDLFLLGLDMALDQQSGATHSDFHSYNQVLELKSDANLQDEVKIKQRVIKAKGNLRDEVYTTVYMHSTVQEYTSIILDNFKKYTKNIFNLSDGVFFPYTKPLEFKNLSMDDEAHIDKTALKKSLKNLFETYSSNHLSDDELKAVRDRVAYCDHIIKQAKKFAKQKHNDIDSYHYNLVGFFMNILDEHTSPSTADLDAIMDLYINFVSGYIFDIINTKELKNHKEIMQNITAALVPNIIKLSEFIKDKLEIFLLEVEKIKH